MFYKKLLRPLTFWLFRDAELVHCVVIWLMETAGKSNYLMKVLAQRFQVNDPRLSQEVFGLNFPNPVGLAAGFTKDADGLNTLTALGYGHITTGTTPLRFQSGNPKPRLFRLVLNSGLKNQMGFNSKGANYLSRKLAKHKRKLKKYDQARIPIGASIGVNKNTIAEGDLDKIANEYALCLIALYETADYFEVNVSSPNTKELRRLQGKYALLEILLRLNEVVKRLDPNGPAKPIVVKVSPDVTDLEFDEILEVCAQRRIAGLNLCNTTITTDGLTPEPHVDKTEPGGYSGPFLFQRAVELIKYAHSKLPNLPIIGTGGVSKTCHVIEMMAAGAKLIQLYTGFIYEGPSTVSNILTGLLQEMDNRQMANVSEFGQKKTTDTCA